MFSEFFQIVSAIRSFYEEFFVCFTWFMLKSNKMGIHKKRTRRLKNIIEYKFVSWSWLGRDWWDEDARIADNAIWNQARPASFQYLS